jgi:hypothetical protein
VRHFRDSLYSGRIYYLTPPTEKTIAQPNIDHLIPFPLFLNVVVYTFFSCMLVINIIINSSFHGLGM